MTLGGTLGFSLDVLESSPALENDVVCAVVTSVGLIFLGPRCGTQSVGCTSSE